MKRAIGIMALSGALLLVVGACKTSTVGQGTSPTASASPSPTPPPTLQLSSAATATVVAGNTATIALTVTGVRIVRADGDTSGQTGHFHVFIDKDPVAGGQVIPKVAGIVHTAENPIHLTGLSDGNHKLVIVLGDGAHRRIGDAQVETAITVSGPSIQLAAPATVAAGEPLRVTATVQGVNLVKAADDKSNKDRTAGHLHIFVNKDPAPPGAPIPSGDPAIIHTASTTTDVPSALLKAGDNTIWVELGFADHTPFDPQILDKVVVTVIPATSPAATTTATASR